MIVNAKLIQKVVMELPLHVSVARSEKEEIILIDKFDGPHSLPDTTALVIHQVT